MVRIAVSSTDVLYAESDRMELVDVQTREEQTGRKVPDLTAEEKKAPRESVPLTRELAEKELE